MLTTHKTARPCCQRAPGIEQQLDLFEWAASQSREPYPARGVPSATSEPEDGRGVPGAKRAGDKQPDIGETPRQPSATPFGRPNRVRSRRVSQARHSVGSRSQ